jgi:hypothetical protein
MAFTFHFSLNMPLHKLSQQHSYDRMWKVLYIKYSEVDDILTWIFEKYSFAPIAKIKADKKYYA